MNIHFIHTNTHTDKYSNHHHADKNVLNTVSHIGKQTNTTQDTIIYLTKWIK